MTIIILTMIPPKPEDLKDQRAVMIERKRMLPIFEPVDHTEQFGKLKWVYQITLFGPKLSYATLSISSLKALWPFTYGANGGLGRECVREWYCGNAENGVGVKFYNFRI